MTIAEYLNKSTAALKAAGIDTARLDSLVLLEDVTGKERAYLLAHPEMQLSDTQITKLNTFISKREQHMPLAYIRGIAPFYGRYFAVNTHTLVPRPETEAMIDMLHSISHMLPDQPFVADIGTGSGCIGITAALELPKATVYLYDIDKEALQVATKNAHTHKVRVQVAQSDLLSNTTEHFDVLLANLPYVPDDYRINPAAGFEPKHALFAGDDGLRLYKALWQQLASRVDKPRHVLAESFPFQHTAQAELAARAGYTLVDTQDFIQRFILKD